MKTYDSLDPDFKNQVALKPGGENAANCFLCGTCTAGCPVSSLNSGYSPRRIMRMLLLGMKDELLNMPELWQCSQCHTCVAHCPQDARPADVIRVLRQIALEEGCYTKEFAEEVEKLDLELKKQRIERINLLTKSIKK
jgi:heterodisulfide reductase subunit C2